MSEDTFDIEELHSRSLHFSDDEVKSLRPKLLSWYAENRRNFPWRGDSGEGYAARVVSPYGTWVSEIMLQQTRTETVIPYWNRWMDKWPTVSDLAAASPEEVNSLWAGLGYYRRAQQLLLGAKMVVSEHDGVLPATVPQLLRVPGIGPYTAGAISSIAYGQSEPVVDGNVIRVLSRLRAIEQEIGPAMTKECWRLSHEIIDSKNPGDFNQSLMELGATVCKPTNPDCGNCPIASLCRAKFLHESQAEVQVTKYPLKAKKKAPRSLVFGVHVLYRKKSHQKLDDGLCHEFLLVKRPSQGLLANQWEFPSCCLSETADINAHLSSNIVDVVMESLGVRYYEKKSTMHTAPDSSNLCLLHSSALEEPITHVFSHQHHTMYITVHYVEHVGNICGSSREVSS